MALVKNLNTKFVCADKGYDSYKNHEFSFTKLNDQSLIKVKNIGIKKSKSYSFRSKAKKFFNENIYHQRSKVESIFSSIKRKYGSCLKARSFYSQKKEVMCKLIAYNLDRIIKDYFCLLRISA